MDENKKFLEATMSFLKLRQRPKANA